MKNVNAAALECTQNGRTLYMVVLTTNILKNICFVSRRETDPIKGFQRDLSAPRAKAIAEYLDRDGGVIPSAIILSAQPSTKFAYNSKTKTITFEPKENSFMVLDGQHRLFGFFTALKNYEIPVIIFNDLKLKQEVEFFIDINTTQKGVSNNLLLDIKNLTGKELLIEERQRNLFNELNKDSVLAGLFSSYKPQIGKINRTLFNRSTKELFSAGFFSDKDDITVYKGVKNYLEAFELIFQKSKSKKARLTSSLYFRAAFNIFNDVIDRALKDYGDLKTESIVNTLNPITQIDYDKYNGNSYSTLAALLGEIKRQLNDYGKKFNDLDHNTLF